MARGLESLEQGSSPSVRKIRSDVPRDLDAILQKCMSANEKERYATAAELIQELQNFLTNRPILARPAGPLARLQKWMRRQPLAAALAVACTVMVTVGLIALVVTDQRTRAVNDQLGITNASLAKAVNEADHERDLAKQSTRELCFKYIAKTFQPPIKPCGTGIFPATISCCDARWGFCLAMTCETQHGTIFGTKGIEAPWLLIAERRPSIVFVFLPMAPESP